MRDVSVMLRFTLFALWTVTVNSGTLFPEPLKPNDVVTDTPDSTESGPSALETASDDEDLGSALRPPLTDDAPARRTREAVSYMLSQAARVSSASADDLYFAPEGSL